MPWSEWIEPPWMDVPVLITNTVHKTETASKITGIYHLAPEPFGSQFSETYVIDTYEDAMATLATLPPDTAATAYVGYGWTYSTPGVTYSGQGTNAYGDGYSGYTTADKLEQYDYSSMNDPAEMLPVPEWWWVSGNQIFGDFPIPFPYEYESTDLNNVDFAQFISNEMHPSDTTVVNYKVSHQSYASQSLRDIDYSASDTVNYKFGDNSSDITVTWHGDVFEKSDDISWPAASLITPESYFAGSGTSVWALPFNLIQYLKSHNYIIDTMTTTPARSWLIPPNFNPRPQGLSFNTLRVTFGSEFSIRTLRFRPPRFRYWIGPLVKPPLRMRQRNDGMLDGSVRTSQRNKATSEQYGQRVNRNKNKYL